MQICLERPMSRTSLWLANSSPEKQYSSLQGNRRCEICVIGAGISGLSAAYYLAKANKHVIVLEKHSIGSGETGYSTAHLSNALHERYYKIEKNYGKNVAKCAANIHSSAIKSIGYIIASENINCDYSILPGYLFSSDDDNQMFEKEYDAACAAGASVEFIDLLAPSLKKCLRFNGQAQFHPVKYLNALAKTISNHDAVIYEDTQAFSVKKHNNGVYVYTSCGYYINADHVILATNNPIDQWDRMDNARVATRTYVIAATILKGTIPKALYWDNNQPYHYVRLHEGKGLPGLSDNEEVILIGGEDHFAHERSIDFLAFERLKQWAKIYFPGIISIRNQWSGCVYDRYDYLHYFNRESINSHSITTLIGGNSNGLTHGTAAGNLIANQILNG